MTWYRFLWEHPHILPPPEAELRLVSSKKERASLSSALNLALNLAQNLVLYLALDLSPQVALELELLLVVSWYAAKSARQAE